MLLMKTGFYVLLQLYYFTKHLLGFKLWISRGESFLKLKLILFAQLEVSKNVLNFEYSGKKGIAMSKLPWVVIIGV